MNVMVDFLMCFLAAGAVFLAVGRNTLVTGTRFGALLIAVALSVPVVHFGAPHLAKQIPNPLSDFALQDLAELGGVDTAGLQPEEYSTLINYNAVKHTPGMEELLAAYGVDRAGTDAAAAQGVQAVAEYMTMPVWQALIGVTLRLLMVVVLYGVLLAVLRSLLYRRFMKLKRKSIAPLTAVFALFSMVVVMGYVVVPVFEAFRPFSMGWLDVLNWDRACADSVVYPVFRMLYLL